MRVLAHVGQSFLHDENHLQLLLVGEVRFLAFRDNLGLEFGLNLKAFNRGRNCCGKAFLMKPLAEVQQQLTDVFVALLHAGADLCDGVVHKRLIVVFKAAFK